MAIAQHGEYSAFTTKNSIRYQKNKKLVSEGSIPLEVVNLLRKQLGFEPTHRFPMPSPEELARMREESLQVKPELQGVNITVTEEQLEKPISEEDFVAEFQPEEVAAIEEIAAEHDGSFNPEPAVEQYTPDVDPDFLESVSIHSASLEDIAQALSDRFGIYTVYLNRLPDVDEIDPTTAETFTKHHYGLVYQQAIRAMRSGVLSRQPEAGRKFIDESRAASANVQNSFVAPARNMAEARRMDTFDYRTSVRGTEDTPVTEIVHVTGEDGVVHAVQRPINKQGRTGEFNGASSVYDAEQEELVVEPRFGKQVIRPNW